MNYIISGVLDTTLIIRVRTSTSKWKDLGYPWVAEILIKLGELPPQGVGYIFPATTRALAYSKARAVVADGWWVNHPYVKTIVGDSYPKVKYIATMINYPAVCNV